ncbi:uncharacterized protein LOC131680194 [Topomyia yanbarensis]|uniref:uncharacterized protein LOC131680194 n=1 Tax=Topomyia yanbarensis TaxID=2498891 RepID=UPI00273B66E3|nr:uncharacterized protein LOC131680194 [Topomyia yanbarensis]
MPAAGTTTSKKPPSMRVFKESHTATDVDVRLCKLDELWEGFSETLVEIFSHDDYNAEGNSWEKERMEFSDRYYEVKSFLMDKAKELQEPNLLEQSLRAGDSSMRGGIDHVRLPQIKLQTFNGDIDEWLSFRDLFTSFIHWKPDLPEVEKFHYLKGCLQGEPKRLIDPLQITKANYQVAWDLLLKRYNNSKQLKKRQVQAFFNLPTLPKESVTDLHVLIEGFERIVQTLDQIIQSADYKDLLLVNILTTRLDPVTRRGWEEFSAMKETDTLADLFDFLRRRLQVLDCLPTKFADTRGAQQQQQQIQAKQRLPPVKTSYSSTHMSGGRCVACSSNHPLYQCSAFQRMEVTERDGLLKTHSLCRNCFRTGHKAKECQSKYSCRSCKGRHHTLVCFKSERDTDKDTKVAAVARGNKPSVPTESSNTSSQVANVAATEVLVAGAAHQYSSQVLLATAVVVIEDDDGNRFPARALLDSGSESNFVTERLSQRMKVTRNRMDISVVGIGQAATKVKHRIQAVLRSRVSQYSRELSFLILPKVTINLPTTTINTDKWAIPDNIQLADPAFFESKVVDLVLGIEAFFDFFETGRRISLGEQLPTLNDSVFGWVVCGGFSVPSRSLHINCNMSTTEDLDTLMSRFWSCEEVEFGNTFSLEEKRCEELFLNTVKRDETGRYTVSLPKDEDAISRLGESRDIALRRLQATERRLARDENLRKQYTDFMEEYLHLGHMRKVEEVATDSVKRCYLPHHPVVKDSSTTTKVRVVFDASCKTSSGLSLNDVLLVGSVIQEDLRSIILRSRTKQIMLVSDVEKMFRQINVCPEDRPLQCILWRNSSAEEISTYELNTVTYGTKPAPFLATRTLKQLALDEEERYPLAAKAAIEDTYMDDVITGADAESGRPDVLNGIEEEELAIRSPEGIFLDPDPSIKTLGLTWMPVTDTLRFQFTIPNLNTEVPLTKRCVLSVIATLFDPLGLLGAAITTAKIFMQLLWTLRDENDQRLDWDQPLPPTVGEAWRKHGICEDPLFSDASEKAYGACLYLRNDSSAGVVWCTFSSTTLRKGEQVNKNHGKIIFLDGFNLCPAITQGSRWSHVPGIQNPADLISRGISPNDIVLNTFWWQGPSWLEKTEEYRPLLPVNLPIDEGDEEKRHTVLAGTVSTIAEFNQLYIGKFSSYSDLLRRTAYWLRLIKLLQTPRKDRKAPTFLSTDELKEAENTLVRLVQREVFVEEWKALSKEYAVSKSSPLRWFNPFVSQDQLIRLGGRLKHSMESENTKHPAVLPPRHIFTRLLLRYYHERLLHSGPQLLLGVVRLRFWPLGGRSVVRHIIHQCHICFRSKPSTVQQFMGDLPASRVTVSRPFSRTGVDYFGPLYVRPAPRRTAVKAYVAIFVCLCTKAVHLELVTDLSTDRFLQALRRFVARRGRCTDIYSDNGTNFVSARNKLQEFLRLLKDSHHNDIVSKQLAKEGIQWHFSPPSAPHFGGIWEAAVRSAKIHLLKVVGETPVSPEDMNTLLVQVEGCLNSRPLTPMSDDPNDLQPLTPAHFLIGESLHAVPDPDLSSIPMNRLTQWQLTQQKLQNFWKRSESAVQVSIALFGNLITYSVDQTGSPQDLASRTGLWLLRSNRNVVVVVATTSVADLGRAGLHGLSSRDRSDVAEG